MVIHVPEQFNISAIDEFFSQLSVSLWMRPENASNCLGQKA